MFRSPEVIAARHAARVYLREARNRRHQPDFHAFLLNAAARARLESMQPVGQKELF